MNLRHEPSPAEDSGPGGLLSQLSTWKLILEQLPHHVMILNREGRFLYLNRSDSNHTIDHVVGRATVFDLAQPEYHSAYREAIDRVLDSGDVQEVVAHNSEHGVWYHSTLKRLDVEWEEELVLVFSRDISEEQEARQNEAVALRRLESILANIPSFVVELAPDGTILTLNKTVPGVTKDQYLGKNVVEVAAFGGAEQTHDALAETLATRGPVDFIRKDIGPQDSEAWYLFQLRPVLRGAEVEYIVMVVTDVTDQRVAQEERVRLERELLQAQTYQSLGLLAGGVAHDFGNLLVGVLGVSDLLLQRLDDKEQIQKGLEQIHAAASQAQSLCRQMLDLTGHGNRKFIAGYLCQWVKDLGELLRVTVGESASLEIVCEEGLPPVKGDPSQVGQVVLNLVKNAGNATGGAGEIYVRVGQCVPRGEMIVDRLESPADSHLFLEVEDNGIGMDADVMGRMFDPFYSTAESGRGLGLAMVMGVVRGHDGAIQVTSAPGAGAAVRVYLPVADEDVITSDAQVDLPIDSCAYRVLIADDNPTVRVVLFQMLESMGHEVTTVTDGTYAVETIRDNRKGFDLAILDVAMPRMSGAEAFRAIRSLGVDIPIVLTSANPEFGSPNRQDLSFASGFLQKPYTLAHLRNVMTSVMSAQ